MMRGRTTAVPCHPLGQRPRQAVTDTPAAPESATPETTEAADASAEVPGDPPTAEEAEERHHYVMLPLFEDRVIDIFEDIEESTADRVRQELDELTEISDDPILVRLNSRGGSAYAGIAIHDLLLTAGPQVIIAVYGNAYSAASIILQAASMRCLSPNSAVMIHESWGVIMGAMNVSDTEKLARESRWLEDRLQQMYVTRTGHSAEQIKEWCKEGTYMTAEVAWERGFADTIVVPRDPAQFPASGSLLRRAVRGLKRAVRAKLVGFLGGLRPDVPTEDDAPEERSHRSLRP